MPPELAWIADAAELERALDAALRFAPRVTLVQQEVPAALSALCEGKASAARAQLGVEFHVQPYGQRAVATRVVSELLHAGVAHQWFRSPDVLALLPYTRDVSALQPSFVPFEAAGFALDWYAFAATGQKHDHLRGFEGDIAIRTWTGTPADREKVDIRHHSVIYNVTDEMKQAMEELRDQARTGLAGGRGSR